MKVKASSNFLWVPSQMYLQARTSMSGLKTCGQRRAHLGVGAVGCHDQVVAAIGFEAIEFRFELQLDAERLGAVLQNIEQPLAPDPAEAVARTSA